MRSIYNNIILKGISVAVPENIETVESFSDVLDSEHIDRQKKFTGIRSRHVCLGDQPVFSLCKEALGNLMEKVGWQVEEPKVLILVTQCPEFQIPSTAFLLHNEFSMSQDCLVFDVNMGCSGFNVGLHVISSILQNQPIGSKGVLLVADNTPDMISDMENVTEEEFCTIMLFGSAAAAVAVEVVQEGVSPIVTYDFSDGSRWDVIHKHLNGNIHMSGLEVYEFATSDVVDYVQKFMKENRLSFEEIDFVLFHQAQKEILDQLRDILELDEDKVLISYEEYGNTSGASQLLTVAANRDTILKKKNVDLIFIGFGVGLSCAVTYIRIQSDIIFPIVTF